MVIQMKKNVLIILIILLIYWMYAFGKMLYVDMEDVKTLIMIVIHVIVLQNVDILVRYV